MRGVCGDAPLADWKSPLRAALDHLASEIEHTYEDTLQPFVKDAWQLRDDYIQVLLKQKTAGHINSGISFGKNFR